MMDKYVFLLFVIIPCRLIFAQTNIYQNCPIDFYESTEIENFINAPNKVTINKINLIFIVSENLENSFNPVKELNPAKYNNEEEALEYFESKLQSLGAVYYSEEYSNLLDSSNDSDGLKKDFEVEMKVLKNELSSSFQAVKQELDSLNYQKLKARVNDLEFKINNILKSSVECFAEDYKIYQLESYSGKPRYGFSLNDLRNDPSYVKIDLFYEGIARVKRFNKFAFIDRDGNVVIDFKYDLAFSIRQNLIAVKRGENAYYIDKKENEYFRHHRFKLTFPIYNNTAIVAREIDNTGRYYNFTMYSKTNLTNNNLRPIGKISGYFNITPFDINGLSIAQKHRNASPELLNHYGENILKTNIVIDSIIKDPFVSHLYRCRVGRLWGLVDISGFIVQLCEYQQMSSFLNNISIVKKNNKWGSIKPSGEEYVPLVFDKIIRLSNNMVKGELNSEVYFIDETGNCLNNDINVKRKYKKLQSSYYSKN